MTHLIQFSVDMDDNAIRDQIVRRTASAVEKAIFGGDGYTRNSFYGVQMSNTMREIAATSADNFIEKHADAIIAAAGEALADKLARTKKARAILDDIEKE